ncbi:MAG: hypothetical protein U0791_24245 [Gemmataceae bacterium]
MSAVAERPRPLTLADIAASIPGARGARNMSPATLTRWILHGCAARDGSRVRLSATRAGSRWLVYQSDLETFFAALAADPAPTPAPKPVRSAANRRKASEAAGRRLQQMGA